MPETNLKKLASKLGNIAGRSSLESKDLETLREIKDGLAAIIASLKECDCCGAAVTEIARLEIDGVRALVCSSCGIKALKNKELVLKNVRKKEHAKVSHPPVSHKAAVKTVIKSKPFKTEPHPETASNHAPRTRIVETQPSLFGDAVVKSSKSGDDMDAIASAASSKVMTVKKIHSIVSGVAFPMNLDRTLSFVRMEAQSQHLNFKEDEIRRVVTALKANGLIRIKDS